MATKATVPTVANGDSWSAAQHNTYLRDNIEALWPYTTQGDLAYASAANQLSRLAKPSVDSVLKNTSGGVPSWLAISEILSFASVYHNTTQGLSTGVATILGFNSEYSDLQGWHDNVTANGRITVGANGVYQASCSLKYSAAGGSGTYWDTVELLRNGTEVSQDRRRQEVDAYDKMFAVTFPMFEASAGNYFNIRVEQNSGGLRTVYAGATFSLLRVK